MKSITKTFKKIGSSYRIKKILRQADKLHKTSTELITTGRIKEELPVFDTIKFKEKTERLKDTVFKTKVLDFIENGYVVIENSVSQHLIDEAVKEFYSWKARNKKHFVYTFFRYDDKLDRIINIQATLPVFKDLFYENKALEIQDYLFQKKTCLWTSLLFEVGSSQSIHRDEPVFWTKPAHNYFGTWLALEDTDATNGPLMVIPGSHKLNPALIDKLKIVKQKYSDLKKIKKIDDELWNIYQSEIEELCYASGLKIKEVYVKKGDTIIWHPLLAHGGAHIKDVSKTRLSYIVHTIPYNTPVYGMDVFFNPEKRVKQKTTFKYESRNSRSITMHDQLTIGHKVNNFDFSILK